MANRVAPINEVLGRFYPGGPIPNKPRKPYGSRKPIQFKDFDAFYEEFFDLIDNDINVGNFFTGELKADFNQSMKATVKAPSDASAAKIPEEFAGELDELPGSVGVSVNLNPVDWIKNPPKEGKKLLGGLIKGTFGYDINSKKGFFNSWDFKDVDSAIEKDFVWDPLSKGKRIGQGRLSTAQSSQNTFARILEKRLTGKEPDSTSTGTGFSDEETKDFLDYKVNKDSYIIGEGFVSEPTNPTNAARSTFVNTMLNLNASGTREDSFTALGTSFLKVLDAESRNIRDVEYKKDALDTQTENLLKQRISSIRGKANNVEDTKVIDPFGNDFLSITSGTFNKYVGDRDTILTSTIPDLQKKIKDLSAKTQIGDTVKDLRKATKDLEDAEKDLIKLDGNIHSAVTQLVAPNSGSYGAANEVVKAIKTSGSTDANLVQLSNKLEVFSDPAVGLTRRIASLRHALFEKDNILDIRNPGLQKDKVKVQEKIQALLSKGVPATDPQVTKLQGQITKIEGDIVKNITRVSDLDLSINNIVVKLQGKKGALAKASASLQGIDSTTKEVVDLTGEMGSLATNKADLLSLEKVSALETQLAGVIDYSIDTARKSLKEKAAVDKGSFVFREQYELLNGINDFYKSFGELSGDLSKANLKSGNPEFDGSKKGLIESCEGQLESFKATAKLLEKDKRALDEFNALFADHLKAVAKLKADAENVNSTDALKVLLRRYKSVYDTATIGGGVGDKTTRRFMESIYFGKGALADTFKNEMSSETFEHSKRMFLIARFRYERGKAADVYKMIKDGPKGLINPIMQRFLKEGQWGRVSDFYQKLSHPTELVSDYILKPTHYFGLIYDEKAAKSYKKYGGIEGWVESHFGEPMSKFWGVNHLSINLPGLDGFGIVGGEHLKGAIALGDLVASGKISSSLFGDLFSAKNIRDLGKIPVLKGTKLGTEGVKDVNDFLGDLQKLKAWFETEEGAAIAKRLGMSVKDIFDAAGNLIGREFDPSSINGNALNFFKFIAALKHNTSATDPTAYLVGRLKIVSQFLSKVQAGYIAIIANIRKPIVYLKMLIAEGLTDAVSGLFASVTGGLGVFLRGAVRFVVNVAVDWGEKLVNSIIRFDLTGFIDEVSAVVNGVLKYMMYFVIAPMIIIIVGFNSVSTMMLGISPVDNSRTNGVLLTGCGPIDERAQGVGSCGICDAPDSVDWNPYALRKATFTEGIAFVLNAAAKDYNIPAAALGAIFYVEGWSENVPGKFDKFDWTKDNVCDWSLNEGPLLPDCETRTSSSDARGSFQWIPDWFDPQIEASGVASKTPIPRGEYNPCNFLDAAYASAGRFRELADALGISGCTGDWNAKLGSKPGGGYVDSLDPADATKIQWAILHYACGAGGSECSSPTFIDYSVKGVAVFNALKCF